MPNERLAKVAYTAYTDVIHHPLDEWDELGPDVKEAWRHVADAVVMAIGTKFDDGGIGECGPDDPRPRAPATQP